MGEVYSSLKEKPKPRAPTSLNSRPSSGPRQSTPPPNTLPFCCSLPSGSQSSLHSSISSHQSSSRSLESPTSSSSSLHNLGPVSLYTETRDLQVPSNGTPSMGQPRATHSPPLAKEHASSCPPSITNSMVDIPIVLINGFPEPGSPHPKGSQDPRTLSTLGLLLPTLPVDHTRSHSQTLPEAPPTVSRRVSCKPINVPHAL